MKVTWLAMLTAVVAMTATSVLAQNTLTWSAEQDNFVWNTGNYRYNWLMDRGVTSSWGILGGDPVTNGSGHGSVGGIQSSLSSAQRVWIPRSNETGRGTNTYWAEIDLGAVRPIDQLRVQTFIQEMSYSHLIVQFSQDGLDYSQQHVIYNDVNNPITSGQTHMMTFNQVYDARYVRVVFPAGTYTSTSAGYPQYGGPGIFGIEPYSPMNTDIVVDGNFNLAINAFTGHNQISDGFNYGNGTALGDGGMSNGTTRAGAERAAWANGASLTVQLRDLDKDLEDLDDDYVFMVDAVRINWNDGAHYSRGLKLEFSMDGKIWDKDAVIVTDPAMLGNATTAAYITFDPRAAQYIRWTQLSDVPQEGYAIAQEFLVYGNIVIVPEPATMTLLAMGVLAMLRRRR